MSLGDIKSYVDGLVRNDEIAAQLFIGGGGVPAARRSAVAARGPGEIQKDATLGPADKVVSGFKRLKIVVKARPAADRSADRVRSPVRVVVDITTRTGIPSLLSTG